MAEPISDNRRIAKNTMYLYMRMLITMVVGLFTSRIVLNTLGVEDYGINNVVGGVVAMFSLISASISGSIGRFLTYELGRGDMNQLKKVFSTSVTIQIILALIIIVVAEIVGIWFLNNKLAISPDRMVAAHWVFHCSLITFAIGLISLPYNASIVSHERMNVFAYMSILETVLKLAIVYMLYISPFDKLKTFAVLGLAVTILMRILYGWYCKRNFEECTYHFTFDKKLFKSMFGFAGWNFFGSGSYILMTSGVNILINLYFGVIANTARGIAESVNGIISQFVSNFTTALNPSIIKSYAQNDFPKLYSLITNGAKYSYLMMLCIAVPFFLEAEPILKLWLNIVPKYTVTFVHLTLTMFLIHNISNTLITAMLATGKIRNYQIIVGGTGFLVLPITYILYHFGCNIESAYYVTISIYIIQLIYRLFLLRNMIGLPISLFLNKVILRITPVTFFVFLICHYGSTFIVNPIIRVISVGTISIFSTILFSFIFALNKHERSVFKDKLYSYIIKFKK